MQAHRFSVMPDKIWVARNKEALMSEVAGASAKQEQGVSVFARLARVFDVMSIVLPQRFVYSVVKPVLVVVLMVGVAGGGWITSVSAAHKSLPGEPLHYLTLAAESAKITVARVSGNGDIATLLEVERAQKRLEEARTLVRAAQTNPVAAEKKKQNDYAKKAVSDAKKSLETVNKDLESAQRSKDTQQAFALAKAVIPEVENVEVTFKEVAVDLQNAQAVAAASNSTATPATPAAADANDEFSKNIEEVAGLVAQTHIAADVVIVKKFEESAGAVNSAVVEQHLSDQIAKLSNVVENTSLKTKKNAEDVLKMQKELQVSVETPAGQQVVETVGKIAQETAKVADSLGTVASTAKEALTKAEELVGKQEYSQAAQQIAAVRELATVASKTASDVAQVAKSVEKVGTEEGKMTNPDAVLPVLDKITNTGTALVMPLAAPGAPADTTPATPATNTGTSAAVPTQPSSSATGTFGNVTLPAAGSATPTVANTVPVPAPQPSENKLSQ